jgi:hypothetical protein
MPIKTQERIVHYIQPEGRGFGLEAMSIKRHGVGDQTLGTIPGRGVLYGRNEFGIPDPKVTFAEPPSGLNTATVTFDPEARLDFLDVMRRENGLFGIWNFYIPKGRLANFGNWTNGGSLDFLAGCAISGGTMGGREKDFSGQPLANTYDLSWRKTLQLLPPRLNDASMAAGVSAEDINDIFFLSDLDPTNAIPGYPGPDKLGFCVEDAPSAATASVFYTLTGGAPWTALGSDPFTTDEHIKALWVAFMTHNTYRLVVLRETADVGGAPEIGYVDITIGSEGGAITWSLVDVGATTNDPGEALFWPLFSRMYIGAGGDVFLSTDQGTTVNATALFSGANAINGFAMQPDTDDVWCVAASNTILVERSNNRGTFEVATGPSGGGDFTAIAVARDGLVYAGNGTSIFLSNNQADSTGGWSSLKDFGANHAVQEIQCVDGESQILRVLVNDGTGTEGDVWYSLDGGNSFSEVADETNLGYNAWYPSEVDPNLVFIAGEDNGTNGVVHKLVGAS